MYKKIFVIAMAMLVALPLCARHGDEHFSFKGIPIDGTMSDFQSSAEKKGFIALKKTPRTVLLFGDYAGRQCRVLVESLPHQDCVWGLTAYLPSCDNWQSLYDTYQSFKKELTSLYGTPVNCVETFLGGESTDNTKKFQDVNTDKCMYKSVFESETGQVDLVIWHDSENGCYVLVSYIDTENSKKQEMSISDNLQH